MRKAKLLNLSDTSLDKAVKIQGTIYDRKRVLSNSDVANAKKMLKAGKSAYKIAQHFGVSPKTIRYNTDPEYREYCIATMSGEHTGRDTYDFADRVEYKRQLVEDGARNLVVEL